MFLGQRPLAGSLQAALETGHFLPNRKEKQLPALGRGRPFRSLRGTTRDGLSPTANRATQTALILAPETGHQSVLTSLDGSTPQFPSKFTGYGAHRGMVPHLHWRR
jgi:hypothetical protein